MIVLKYSGANQIKMEFTCSKANSETGGEYA